MRSFSFRMLESNQRPLVVVWHQRSTVELMRTQLVNLEWYSQRHRTSAMGSSPTENLVYFIHRPLSTFPSKLKDAAYEAQVARAR